MSTPLATTTGVHLSKILEEQTKILEGQTVVKTDKSISVSRFFWGEAPGLTPLKSTPIVTTRCS